MTTACQHCGQPSPAGQGFCCAGCKAAYTLINGLSLGSYYERRTLDSNQPPQVPEEAPLPDMTAFITTEGNIQTVHLMVGAVHCAACAWLIETVLSQQSGVTYARMNLTTRRLTVRWDRSKTTAQKVLEPVHQLGYTLRPYRPELLETTRKEEEKHLLLCLAVAGFAAANVMLLSVALWADTDGSMGPTTRLMMQGFSALIVLPAAVWAGQPFFTSALRALRHGRLNMDVPISLAVLLTLGLSIFDTLTQTGGETYFESAAMLLFFLLLGRYLDSRARGRSRAAAEQLAGLQAGSALRLNGQSSEVVPLSALAAGDTVLVAKGERIPADGVVLTDTVTLDTAFLTGESLPTQLHKGDTAFAGSLNAGDALKLRMTARAADSRLAHIVALVEEATTARNRYTLLADRVARLYAPLVHVLAAATFALWWLAGAEIHTALTHAVAVLLVTCPCALALAVPSVQVAAVTRLLRQGVLLTSASALERLKDITTVVLDKTGTLTSGRITVEAPSDTLAKAARLAVGSTHPLARAVVAACPQAEPAKNVREIPGQGLEGKIGLRVCRLGSAAFCGAVADDNTPLWFRDGSKPAVPLTCQDTLRPDAAAAVAAFKQAGLPVMLLSGDRQSAVDAVAAQTGITEAFSHQSPEDKHAALKKLSDGEQRVLMIGDGINDAPALALAHASMTLATGSDVAKTAADVILQHDRLMDAVRTWRLSKRAHRMVLGNFTLAVCYNTVAVPLAMAGYITPLGAAVLMSASSVTVVLNTLRLLRD
ncbi:MAG: cadmium-translocating P-type ATPase [Proteobacteria bacterium]|nr:cadmium-translocating P-type ATPase [Pseudomonadota bacterium]